MPPTRATAPAALLIAALSFANAAAAADKLPRAASTTLCGDQYLLALAAPGQIASVSWQATGPLSHHADRALGLPSNRGSVEELVAAGAEVVVSSRGTDPQRRRVLDAFDIAHVRVETAAGFEGVAANVRRVAQAIGRDAAGEALIASMEARLAAMGAASGDDEGPLVAYFRPDGGGAAAGTFVDAVLRAAGYRNLQTALGQRGWARLPAEALVRHPPEGFVLSFLDTRRTSVRTELGRNPIVARAMREGHVITVPGRLLLCVHPLLVDAVALLASERPGLLETRP